MHKEWTKRPSVCRGLGSLSISVAVSVVRRFFSDCFDFIEAISLVKIPLQSVELIMTSRGGH